MRRITKTVAKLAVLVLLCDLACARVLFAREEKEPSKDETDRLYGKAKALTESRDEPNNNNDGSPAVGDEPEDANNNEAQPLSNNEIDPMADPNYVEQIRHPRAAAGYYGKDKDDDDSRKHVKHIPVQNSSGHHKGTPPPPDSGSDETLDSLEANREAFLELLDRNAKYPHRHRSSKKHSGSSKMNLKFDSDLQRWTLIERTSDEWW